MPSTMSVRSQSRERHCMQSICLRGQKWMSPRRTLRSLGQTSFVQGLVQNSPFSHTREVISPSCRVTKEGRGSNEPFPSTEASRVAFEIIGVTLACAH